MNPQFGIHQTNTNTPSPQFPYALRALPPLLENEPQWPPTSPDSSPLAPYILAFPADCTASPSIFLTHITQLSDANSKAPPLKALQGYLWTRGYDRGELVCPLFPDVAPALRRWTKHDVDNDSDSNARQDEAPTKTVTAPEDKKSVMIYSSGSIAAQRLLFSHTTAGDLTPLISAYFDPTTSGPKTAASSYAAIFQQSTAMAAMAATRTGTEAPTATANATAPPPTTMQTLTSPAHILFLSDNVLEVRAALAAGMRACVVVREGNAPLTEDDVLGLAVVRDFGEVGI